ncbi:cell wall biogenesis protein Mhp1 [Phlyctema vagabunda]|uniref:Cell wall biogenesis protein Mhp1 n=1 Tax=Phlyctema vagabunda TaxID=108571 RepID=A0ABR4PHJ5_9HELO
MESVHGVDVSWMQHSSKDNTGRQRSPSESLPSNQTSKSPQNGSSNGHAKDPPPSQPKTIPHRPSFSRSTSTDKTATINGTGSNLSKSMSPPTPTRRNSWLSSISSKFSSSPSGQTANAPPATPMSPTSPQGVDLYVQKAGAQSGSKTAILAPASKETGDEPYVPAPPKQNQPSFLQSAFRRLSSSGGQLSNPAKNTHHGLCERRTLNVDHNRERCLIAELDQAKLRRVAFCVDVEIASGPRYIDDEEEENKVEKDDKKKEKKKRVGERGEGEALKHPDDLKNEKETAGVVQATGEKLPHEPEKEGKGPLEVSTEMKPDPPSPPNEKETTKKKEKKKRSEEERKARKEKKRKLAEANGTVPVELVRNISDDSLSATPTTVAPKTQASPTTDPVRIYRRCCQLRETPILKKITEQLALPSNSSLAQPGVVQKLDLTGYWLQLPDLITLGDYLAVVPVKELIMENTGLFDEGIRVILAGLLATKPPEFPAIRRAKPGQKDGECPKQGGFVERLVFKNNPQIGRDGWRHICLFIHMCRSLKSMDLSKVPFPQSPPPTPAATPSGHHHLPHLPHTAKRSMSTIGLTSDLSNTLAKSIGDRLGGAELELLNMAECGMNTEQLEGLVDGICKSGLRRLGVAGNNITAEGIQHIARWIRTQKCEGLDLGGNDLKDTLEVIVEALNPENSLLALSLADCNLTPESLWKLFPALSALSNFRFIDLSQNRDLFTSKPSAIPILRRDVYFLPHMKRQLLTLLQILAQASGLKANPSYGCGYDA